jgi:tricorn protease
VNANREKVAQATNGRIAHIHVPNTAMRGIQEFTKQFYPQADRDGGSTRDGEDFRTPPSAMDGPKCILINQYAGSGGDAFPHWWGSATTCRWWTAGA